MVRQYILKKPMSMESAVIEGLVKPECKCACHKIGDPETCQSCLGSHHLESVTEKKCTECDNSKCEFAQHTSAPHQEEQKGRDNLVVPMNNWKDEEKEEFGRLCFFAEGGKGFDLTGVQCNAVADYLISRMEVHEKKVREEIAKEIEAKLVNKTGSQVSQCDSCDGWEECTCYRFNYGIEEAALIARGDTK